MTAYNVSELDGDKLDLAVALAEGWLIDRPQDHQVVSPHVNVYRLCRAVPQYASHDRASYHLSPSTRWDQCGALIDKYGLGVAKCGPNDEGTAYDGMDWAAINNDDSITMDGPTGQIAVCRVVIAMAFGDTVELPV